MLKGSPIKTTRFQYTCPQYYSLFLDSRDTVKGLVAMDLDGTRDKLVVAFDVDANRQHNIVMKYNVQVQKILSTDSRLHYL